MTNDPWGDEGSRQEAATPSPAATGDKSHEAAGKRETREWKLIEKLVNGLHVEHRRTRRWGIFFKSLTFIYLFTLLALYWNNRQPSVPADSATAHVAVIQVSGPIADSEKASADALVGSLRRAFEAEKTSAVILRINSPGGSPVQAGYVYDEIRRQQQLHPEKKVYAVITDIGASGAYYIAAAADQIYADKASLVGSIGVVSSSFGFVDLMDKLGVERRMLTAGEHKGLLDPFQPLPGTERAFWQSVLDTTHRQFIDQVRKGRGDRLAQDDKLFSGLVWTGEQALELGLVDGLGSAGYVAREVIGVEKMVDYTQRSNRLEQLIEKLGVSIASHLSTQLGLNGQIQLR